MQRWGLGVATFDRQISGKTDCNCPRDAKTQDPIERELVVEPALLAEGPTSVKLREYEVEN